MASISKQPNGRRTIQFFGADGKRRSIRLGKVSQRMAEAVKVRVEHLAAASITGHAVDDETARWLAGLGPELAAKLAAVGLIPKRQSAKLKAFLDRYIQERESDLKPLSITMLRQTADNLVEHFGADRLLHTVTPGDADRWRLSLVGKRLADNTVRRRCGRAKQFFGAAMRDKLVSENPFAGLKATVRRNPDRFYFVSREEAKKVLDACLDAQWRLLFALSRFGGLRCPSEHLALTWDDINWAEDRFTVRSPKTEHHEGKGSRVVPIFPELRPYLDEAWDLAERGDTYVITRYRDSNSNLRTQLNRIIERAGLEAWPKLFQNLRSTRQTELEERFPSHVVCGWMGNSERIAARHYLQTTEDHFEQALQPVQNAVQHAHAEERTAAHGVPVDSKKHYCTGVQVAEAGLEPARG